MDVSSQDSSSDLEFFERKEKIPHEIEISKRVTRRIRTETLGSIVQRGTTEPTTAAAEPISNLCYLSNNLINVYCSCPDPNPRGGGQSAILHELGVFTATSM